MDSDIQYRACYSSNSNFSVLTDKKFAIKVKICFKNTSALLIFYPKLMTITLKDI